jgi:4-hydroxy-L-threonine phosphate dehydrogenase PdxA
MPTVDQMADIFSHVQEENLAQYADVLNAAMDEFGIDTPAILILALNWYQATIVAQGPGA